jgi:MFS family permease
VATLGAVLASAGIAALFLPAHPLIPVVALFAAIMVANAIRTVSLNALTTRVPPPPERARYMSAQSAVQHVATSAGAIASTFLLHERPDHGLDGVPRLGVAAIVLSLGVPLLMARVSARLRARDGGGPPATGASPA